MAFRLEANPILVKELRSRMRGGRAFALLTGFLLGLGLVAYGLYLLATRGERFGATILSSQVGQTLFAGMSFTLLALICIITPAIAVGAISGERERLTYEMLMTTPLAPSRLLWGKLISALSYVLLLIAAAVPLGSIIYIFGGVSARDLLKALAIILMTALSAAMLGLFASTLTRRTARAAVLAYLVMALLLGGLLFGAVLWRVRKDTPVPQALVAPNPVSAMASAIAVLTTPATGMGEMGMFMPAIDKGRMEPIFFGPMGNLGQGMDLPGWSILSIGVWEQQPAPANAPPPVPRLRPVWRDTLVIEAMASLLLFWLALHLVRPRRKWRPGREDLLMSMLSLLVLLAAGFWRGWWALPV